VGLRASNGLGLINYFYCIINDVTGRGIAVDPAWDLSLVREAFSSRGAALDAVLLTHAHWDHVDLARPLAEEFGCDVWISAVEQRTYGFACPNLRLLEGDGVRCIGTVPVDVWSTPGHTAGSVCYRVGDVVLTGDTLFAEGCGVCCGEAADPVAMYRSLQRLQDQLRPSDRVLPGHSYKLPPGQTFARVREENIYLQLRSLEDFVHFRMRPQASLGRQV
jgi:hydroxyacylglutathione hydrolase